MSKFWKKPRSIPVAVNVSVEEDTYISQGRESRQQGSVHQQQHGLQQPQPTSPIRSSTSFSDSDSSSSVQRPEGAHTSSSTPTNPVLANIHRQTKAAPIPVKLPSKSRKSSRSQPRSRTTRDVHAQPIESQAHRQHQRSARPEHKREPSDPKIESQHDIEAYGTVIPPFPFSQPVTSPTTSKLKGLHWFFPPKSSGASWIRRYIFIISLILAIIIGVLVTTILVARVPKPNPEHLMWDSV